jgi:Xaa-Pro aminopeptidase
MTRAVTSILVFLASSLVAEALYSSKILSGRTSLCQSQLFMNKKKTASNKQSKTKSQGFATAFSRPSNGFPYAGSIRPGKQSPQRIVVDTSILFPDYAKDGIPKKGKNSPLLPWIIEVKTPAEIEKMRAAGKLAREILDLGGRAVAAGVTTDEIDTIVHEASVKVGLQAWA